MYRVTVSMPCFGRPKRTMRAIDCILAQSISGWEALIVGDGCEYMSDLITSGYYRNAIQECEKKGNRLVIDNYLIRRGGWGYQVINDNIRKAKGKYFVFLSNDDVIKCNHLENYLKIENTDYDFVFFNTFVEPTNTVRIPELREGGIGHSELIVRTDFLRAMPPHTDRYGHDWDLISSMVKAGARYGKIESGPTYIVKGAGELRSDIID